MSYLEEARSKYGRLMESNEHIKRAILAIHVMKDIMHIPGILTMLGVVKKDIEKCIEDFLT